MSIYAAIENAIARSESLRRKTWISKMRHHNTCCLKATKMTYNLKHKTYICHECKTAYIENEGEMIRVN